MSQLPISAEFLFSSYKEPIVIFDLWNTIIDSDSPLKKNHLIIEFIQYLRKNKFIIVLISMSNEEETKKLIGHDIHLFHYCAFNVPSRELECFGKSPDEMIYISANFSIERIPWHLPLDIPICQALIEVFDIKKDLIKEKNFLTQLPHSSSANALISSSPKADVKLVKYQSTSSMQQYETNLLFDEEPLLFDLDNYKSEELEETNETKELREDKIENEVKEEILDATLDSNKEKLEIVSKRIKRIRSEWFHIRSLLFTAVDELNSKIHPIQKRLRLGTLLWNSLANHISGAATSSISSNSSNGSQGISPLSSGSSTPQTPTQTKKTSPSSTPSDDTSQLPTTNFFTIPQNYLYSHKEPAEIPKLEKTDRRITLCLNLDGALIHTIPLEVGLNVNIRPYCRPFLSEIESMKDVFDVILFASSPKIYTQTLISNIESFSIFNGILHQGNCSQINGFNVKDINLLGRDCSIIIDFNPLRILLNHRDAIPMSCWRKDDKHDKELLNILELLKKIYSNSFHCTDAPSLRFMIRQEISSYNSIWRIEAP